VHQKTCWEHSKDYGRDYPRYRQKGQTKKSFKTILKDWQSPFSLSLWTSNFKQFNDKRLPCPKNPFIGLNSK
jgi:hypothetical protein